MTYYFPFFFWLQMLYFWICVFLAFFIPGNFLLRKIKVHFLTNFTLSIGIGMILWGFQGLIFGYLHIRWASYLYLSIFSILWLKVYIPLRISNPFRKIAWKKFALPLFLIVIGCFMQLSTVWFDGIPSSKGDFYCCGDQRDNLVHIAITKAVAAQIPPMEPGMYGQVIKNYHYFGSVIVGEMVRVFNLPLIATDYQYMTILVAVLLGLSVIALGSVLDFPLLLTNWILFFFYFGGDLVYGLRLITAHQLSFSMSSLEDGSKFLANYPRAFGIDALIIGLILLFLLLKDKKNILLGILMALVFGSIISLKVYVGIFVIVGLLAVAGVQVLKKNFSFLLYVGIALAVSIALYLPVNAGAGGLYYTGFWLFENYITQSGFHLIRWEFARVIYQQHHNYLRVWSYEALYIFVYIVSIFGTKVLGFFQTKKSLHYFPFEMHIFLISGMIVSFIAGAFFQQSTGGANTFNFLVSVFILSSFYAGLACFYWIKKFPLPLAIAIVGCVIVLTVPRVLFETGKNIYLVSQGKGSIVPSEQLKLFDYIRTHTPGNALFLVDQRWGFEADNQEPYVYVYTGRRMYLSGQGDELEAHGINFEDRKKSDEMVKGHNRCTNAYLLSHMSIDYIVTGGSYFFLSSQSASFLHKEYSVGDIKLFKVKKDVIQNFLKSTIPSTNCNE